MMLNSRSLVLQALSRDAMSSGQIAHYLRKSTSGDVVLTQNMVRLTLLMLIGRQMVGIAKWDRRSSVRSYELTQKGHQAAELERSVALIVFDPEDFLLTLRRRIRS